MAIQIENPENKNTSFSLFALGFRPFFLLAAFSAFTLMLLWLLELTGKISISGYYTATGWHAHEMLFAYTVAVVSGFLLTAVGNWTGMKMINGWYLVLLTFVFLLGRFAPFVADLQYWVIALSDLAFLPLVAIIIAIPVIKAKQWSNFVFIPLLLAMATANLLVHLSALNILDISIVIGSRAMLYLIVLLIIIMGGRVIPFFTERGVQGVTTKKWNWVERLAPLSVIALMLVDVFYTNNIITGYVAIFAAIIHFIRLFGWYSNKIWQVPLVWILQLAYSWFIIGFIIKGLAIFNINESLFSYHALTVGGIGIMTLGMMARVSLGHTGREMILNRWMVVSFVLVTLAAIVRVILPLFITEYYLQFIQISGWLWTISFVIFFLVYTPMWMKPRVDGREG